MKNPNEFLHDFQQNFAIDDTTNNSKEKTTNTTESTSKKENTVFVRHETSKSFQKSKEYSNQPSQIKESEESLPHLLQRMKYILERYREKEKNWLKEKQALLNEIASLKATKKDNGT